MNYICQSCFEEIKGDKYALPFDNPDNVCHEECLEDWFQANLQDVMYEVTTFVKGGEK